MTIRQFTALFYAIAALGIGAVQLAPEMARAVVPAAVPQPIPAAVALPDIAGETTGHPEIDDLPSYLTDGPDRDV